MELSVKFDYIISIREERVLNSEDFRMISNMFKPNASPSSTNILIKAWETLTDDTVTLRYGKNKIIDNNPRETVKKIKERIGWDI